MLAIISPAKTLDFTSPIPDFINTSINNEETILPSFLAQSEELVSICRTLSPQDLATLMHISDKLAGLNIARFVEWHKHHTQANARPAICAFKGDVYIGLDVNTLTSQTISFAQQHCRILSGLYALLRPLDLIQPYRLDIGTKLENQKGKNLYDFWGVTITHALQSALSIQGDDVLINLASDEYFKAIKVNQLKAQIIKPIFLDFKNGKYKVISFYAKRARGLMCRYFLENQLQNPKDLKDFQMEGYYFTPRESTADTWVFKRDSMN